MIWRKIITFIGMALICCAPALADQSPLFSPTTGVVTGLQFTLNYNAAFNALASCNSGASAPTNTGSGTPIGGQCWLNTSGAGPSYPVEIFDGTQWEIVGYINTSTGVWTSGGINTTPGFGTATSIASASTVDLGTLASHLANVTGTTTITSFGSSASTSEPIYVVYFAGALTLTNSSALTIPGGLSIPIAAGDSLIVRYVGSGNWQVMAHWPGAGASTVFPTYTQCGFSGLQITNGSTTALTIASSAGIMVDSSGRSLPTGAFSFTLNTGTAGNLGIDTGSVAASSWYNVFVDGNGPGGSVSAILSLSATAPSLPSGWTYACRAGAVPTDSGANLVPNVMQRGAEGQYFVGSTNLPLGGQGVFGNPITPTWASILVAGRFVPPTATRVYGVAYDEYDHLMVAPDNSYGAVTSESRPPPVMSTVTTGAYTAKQFDFLLESSNIYAISDNSANAVWISGWRDSVNAN